MNDLCGTEAIAQALENRDMKIAPGFPHISRRDSDRVFKNHPTPRKPGSRRSAPKSFIHEERCACGCGCGVFGPRGKKYHSPTCKARARQMLTHR